MKITSHGKFEGLQVGDQRIVEKFAWLPVRCVKKTIKGDTVEFETEIRWLEHVAYLEEVVEEMNYGTMDFGHHLEWRIMKFIDYKK